MEHTTIPEVPVAVFMLVTTVIFTYCAALALHVIYKRTGRQWAEDWSTNAEKSADVLGLVVAMYIIVAFISLVLTKLII